MQLKENQRSNIRTSALTALIMAHSITNQAQTTTTETNGITKLPDVVVTGQQEFDRSYATTNSVTATKMDIPLLKTRQALSIVPRALLDAAFTTYWDGFRCDYSMSQRTLSYHDFSAA
jgi:outer membrane receptor for ferric coprogen and ferric-rhodotorulic acid